MSASRTAQRILEQDYLSIRCLILDLASALDRIDRGAARGEIEQHPQLELLRSSLTILQSEEPNRAERVQLHFSDQYQPGWNR